jgi:hypothetical protein
LLSTSGSFRMFVADRPPTSAAPACGTWRKIAHYAMDNDLSLKDAALKLGFVTEAEFDHVVDPKKMVRPYWQPTQRVPARLSGRGKVRLSRTRLRDTP